MVLTKFDTALTQPVFVAVIGGRLQSKRWRGITEEGTFLASCAAQGTVRACRRRSLCGVFRVWLVLSTHFSPGFAPHVAHGTANICFAETLVLLMLGALCQMQWRGNWSIVHTDRSPVIERGWVINQSEYLAQPSLHDGRTQQRSKSPARHGP